MTSGVEQTEEAEKRMNVAIEELARALNTHLNVAVVALVSAGEMRDFSGALHYIETIAHNAREDLTRKAFRQGKRL